MPITSEHRDYIRMVPMWQRVTDCLSGTDAVKARADLYLPMLSGHVNRPGAYAAYAGRALWYGATARTVEALVGTVYRRNPTVELTNRLKLRMNNINGRGDNINTFSAFATEQNLTKGRFGILTDVMDATPTLPHLAGYTAENIRNWRFRTVRGQPVLDQLVLTEDYDEPEEDGYGAKSGTLWRVLELDAAGYYFQRTFKQFEGSELVQIGEGYPHPSGRGAIQYIPFQFIGPNHTRPDVSKPPILDLVDVNLSHFRSSADLEEGRHKLAFPIPVLIGVDDSQTTWRIGGDAVWMLPMGADAKMLEFTGQGLGSLERALEQKETYLAHLGSRLLETQKRVTETADALRTRASSENASLSSVARTTSDGIAAALRIAAEWVGDNPDDIAFELNQDFYDSRMSAEDLTALIGAVQAGLLPLEDYFWNLKQGEMMHPDRSIEEARQLIQQTPPTLLGLPMENLDMEGAAERDEKRLDIERKSAEAAAKAAAKAAAQPKVVAAPAAKPVAKKPGGAK